MMIQSVLELMEKQEEVIKALQDEVEQLKAKKYRQRMMIAN